MKTNTATGCLEFLTTKLFPLTISIISLLLSTVNLYINFLRSPDISFVTAPYISQVVDNSSHNEAFFIPLTVINRGARPGTVLNFELTVTDVQTQKQAQYTAQYFAKPDEQRILGPFFSPISLEGYSSESQTVCFYPLGLNSSKILKEAGNYKFQIRAVTANVRNGSQKSVAQSFTIALTDEMVAAMQATPDGEYPFPIKISD